MLVRHHIKLGENSAALKKTWEEVLMKFYFQAGKTLADQDLILAQGEYLMLQGELTEALAVFNKSSEQMQQYLGLNSFKALNFMWKLGEIYLHLGEVENA